MLLTIPREGIILKWKGTPVGYMERKIKMNGSENTVKHKARPRSDEELRQLQNRLSRITGQLNGIGRMLEENRYCGDVLMQVAAVEKALQALGYMILQSHMETCMVDEIEKGNMDVIDEIVGLVKNLK